MEDLKPCPFCGHTDIEKWREGSIYYRCDDCGAQGPMGEDIKEAINLWNKRKTKIFTRGDVLNERL